MLQKYFQPLITLWLKIFLLLGVYGEIFKPFKSKLIFNFRGNVHAAALLSSRLKDTMSKELGFARLVVAQTSNKSKTCSFNGTDNAEHLM